MDTTTLSKSALATQMGIARSSLYYTSRMKSRDAPLLEKILIVHAEHPFYGHRRIAMALKANHEPIRRIMKVNNIVPLQRKRKQPFKPDDQGNLPTKIPNQTKNVSFFRPNDAWAADFTYLSFRGRMVYLATTIDLCTREIVGWHIAIKHTAHLIIMALTDATTRHGVAPGVGHSDQGSEYMGEQYQALLLAQGTQPSASSKGCPWQNGYQESFYSQFKIELGNIERYDTLGELVEAIHQQIFYYNSKRIHTGLKMSPQEYKKQWQEKNTARTAKQKQQETKHTPGGVPCVHAVGAWEICKLTTI